MRVYRLPEAVREVNASSYLAVLYSAIDVLEPQNNMPVWRVSLSTKQQNTNKANRLTHIKVLLIWRLFHFNYSTPVKGAKDPHLDRRP